MIAIYLILAAAIGFVGGYLTAQYWGKPAQEWKKLEEKGIEIYTKARETVDKL